MFRCQKVRSYQISGLWQWLTGVIGMDSLGCEANKNYLPMVLELENKGAALEDSVIPRQRFWVTLVHLYIIYTLIIIKVGTINIHHKPSRDSPVDNRFQLIKDIIIWAINAMQKDTAITLAEEVATDEVQCKPPKSLLWYASKELEAVVERGKFLGNGRDEVRDRLICEAGLLAITRLDINSSFTLFSLVIYKKEWEMWRFGSFKPILVDIANGLCLLDTIAFNDYCRKYR
jgi:hypothetical protein